MSTVLITPTTTGLVIGYQVWISKTLFKGDAQAFIERVQHDRKPYVLRYVVDNGAAFIGMFFSEGEKWTK